MSRKIKKINFIDLEATCYQDNRFPENEIQEIIEIGICQVDIKNLKIEKKSSILIKPKNSSISEYCTNLTGLTQNIIDKDGTSFENAIEILKTDYQIRKHTWMSWGNFDRILFEEQCQRENIKYPFNSTHTNFKYIFSLLMFLDYQIGLSKAIEHIGINFEGTPHRGIDDALNVARIYIKLMKKNRNSSTITF